MKSAVIVGCEGQDGRIAFDFLRAKGYRLLGIDKEVVRGAGSNWREKVDIASLNNAIDLIRSVKPDEVYFFAAYHNSSEAKNANAIELFNESYKINCFALINFLEAIRAHSIATKLFYAASSLIFEGTDDERQNETTAFAPQSVYAITKLNGLLACRYYQKYYGVFASVGILYNHESSLRNEGFVSKKIVKGALNVKNNKQSKLILGNLDAEADWGYAPDFIDAMYRILQLKTPDTFVVATGIKHSVREFATIAFECLGLDWRKHVEENKDIIQHPRKTLVGDSSKLTGVTGWRPTVDFVHMIDLLVKEEVGVLTND